MSTRQRLRPWLEERINSREVPGLEWWNKQKTEFKITWKHAGKPDFNLDTDAALFRMWAEHTGKYKPGEQPDPSTWKTRFRCALHKMPDIEEVRVPHSLDDNVPYRVFRLKPKIVSSPKPRKNSINHSFSMPSPSPPLSDFNSCPYPPNGFHGMMCSQKNPVSMGYTAEMFPFPSPISSHTSSPTNMADFNGTLFDDIDRINPTLPPMPPFVLDQQLDHVGLRQQQHPIPALNDDFFFKGNNCQYNPTSDYEPTLTELQTVSRGEQFSYSGGASGAVSSEAMTYMNNLPYSMTGSNGQNFTYAGQNGSASTHHMGLLNMLHSQPPLEMIQEMGLVPPISGEMEVPYSSPDEVMMSYSMNATRKNTVDLNNNHSSLKNREIVWSCRVYYNNKEVSSFELNSKHTWKICYQKPDKLVDETSFNESSYKLVLLPESPPNDDDVQAVLDDLESGLIVEMLHNGVTWMTKSCQSKVFMSRGPQEPIKLSRDTRTKVLTLNDVEDRKPNDVEFMVSIGEEPLGALVKIVLVPVRASSYAE